MKIYLKRHLKVDLKWKRFYTSNQFDEACKLYDASPVIIPQKASTLKVDIQKVYISELLRTSKTFDGLKLNFIAEKTNLLNEVPLKSFTDTKLKIPTLIWMIFGRIQWYFENKRQIEGKSLTYQRIETLIKKIEDNNQNCLLIGHGFYFSQMKKVLLNKEYIGNNKNHYKNGEVVEFKKQG